MSISDATLALHYLIHRMLNNESHIYCYVGYSKAFDFVNRQNLWYKLIQQSVQHRIFTIVQLYMTRKCFI